MKQLFRIILFVTLVTSLVACSTAYHLGDGVVVSEKKIAGRNYQPHEATRAGAVAGGTVGAIGGAAAGGLFGLALGSFVGSTTMLITTLVGAGVGAAIVGATGLAVGGGVGYIVDAANPNVGLYEYSVKTNYAAKPVMVRQYTSGPIPVNSQVHVLETANVISIKAK